MPSPLRIGLVGLDTSHAVEFAALLNDPDHPHHVPGARVVVGWPGGVEDFPPSINRVAKFTQRLRDEFRIDIVDQPEGVAAQCDLIALTTCDGRAHAALYERLIGAGKPIFIDKPFTTSTTDAQRIVALSREHNVPTMSCSLLRYADNFRAILGELRDAGGVVAIDACGPLQEQPPMPGFMWYGCHTAELLVAAMGTGLAQVTAVKTDDQDVIICRWGDGRLATIRGLRGDVHKGFGVTLHGSASMRQIDCKANDRPFYASLWEAILRSLPHGKSDVPVDQMVEVVRLMEAANQSRDTGQPVTL